MWVAPEPGLFAYWTVIVLSLMATHIMVYTHRRCVAENTQQQALRSSEAEALAHHAFRTPAGYFRLNRAGVGIMVFQFLLIICAIIIGSIITAYTFHIKGLVAWLLNEDDFAIDRTYSLWSMFMNLPDSSPHPNGVTIRAIQALYLLFAFIVPILQQIMLAVLWLMPLRPRSQELVYWFSEICFAWSALEVYLLSIIVALLQLPQLAQFIIGSKCDAINALLRTLFEPVLGNESMCFDVSTELNHGTLVLGLCVLLNFVVTIIVMRMSRFAINDRNSSKQALLLNDPLPSHRVGSEKDPLLSHSSGSDGARKHGQAEAETQASIIFRLGERLGLLERTTETQEQERFIID
ncbi:uncharacterized protein MONBRDRAFT_31417 [Monosiga brevicollis MX1]|uniref:Uncharacterized protein n=1 Tax=Monosiga brevicollis TaxID=81824 RepID=A9UT13_MONBE|nr:uncharacterized protein MONBRDRAFT_31417 [Monosiga brevicollis MX1]EDQ91162.1 predicted protein [Monosiga brevicollis MX1]|eukprot:XP_001743584.1 hypothetical protein [Monosiga brevicollis MX1]